MTNRDRIADDDAPRPRSGVSVWQVIKSVLAAAFGVQTQQARERDFTRGNPAHYIIGGAVFTVLFVAALVVIVRLVLASAGA